MKLSEYHNGKFVRKLVHRSICPNCLKEFVLNTGNQVFCSQKCHWTYNRLKERKGVGLEKTCICGKKFITIHGNQRFCSHECTRKQYKPIPKIFSVRKCEKCGTDYTPSCKTQRYCSNKCRNTVKNKKKSERYKKSNRYFVNKMGKCEVCGFSVKEALEAHHYTKEDRIVLCGSCHNIWHKLSKNNHSLRDMVISTVSTHLLNSQISLTNALILPKGCEQNKICPKTSDVA